jgi:hypothetical protein
VQCDFDATGKPLPAIIDGGLRGAAAFPFDKQGLPQGFGPGTGNYLERGASVYDSNYVTLSGLAIRGIAGFGVLSWRASHVRVEFTTVEWTANSGMLLTNGNPTDPRITDMTAAHCRINQSNLGAWANASTGQGFDMRTEALSLTACDGFSIHGNHVSNSLMEGIDFKFGSAGGAVHHNWVENTRSVGIYANEGRDTDIHHNLVARIGYYDPQDGSGTQLAGAYLASRVPGSPSTEDGATGIAIANGDLNNLNETGRCSGIRVYENLICWTRKSSLTVWNEWRVEGRSGWVLDNIHVFNNVAYGSCQMIGRSASAILVDVGLTNGSVCNNIIMASQEVAFDVWELNSSFFANNTVSHNLMFNNRPGGVTGTSPIQLDPLFVRTPSSPAVPGNFQLTAASPAVNAGTPVQKVRAGATQFDVGAFQFGLPAWRPIPQKPGVPF